MRGPLDAAKFFDRFAAEFDTLYDEQRGAFMRWFDRTFRSDMFVRWALTFERLPDMQGKSVLDIGCGSGPYLLEALRRGAKRVTGVDPAGTMLALAERRLRESNITKDYDLVQGYFPGVTLPQHDLAIVMGVLDYVEDAESFLRAMKPLIGVAAAVSFPSHHWFRGPVRRFRYRLRRCPLFLYDAAQIETLARSAGYTGVDIVKIPGAGMDYHVCLTP